MTIRLAHRLLSLIAAAEGRACMVHVHTAAGAAHGRGRPGLMLWPSSTHNRRWVCARSTPRPYAITQLFYQLGGRALWRRPPPIRKLFESYGGGSADPWQRHASHLHCIATEQSPTGLGREHCNPITKQALGVTISLLGDTHHGSIAAVPRGSVRRQTGHLPP